MQQTQLKGRENFLRKPLVIVDRSLERLELLALLDQRVNDKGLVPGFNLTTNQTVGAFAFLRGENMRRNGFTPGRHLVHHR